MSLRLKLVLLVLGLTLALLGGLGVAIASSLRGWTAEVVDAELRRRADALIDALKVEHGRLELDDDDDDLGARGTPFRVETRDGRLLLGSGADWPAVPGFTTATGRTGEQLRVLSVEFTPPDGDEALVLRVAAPLTAFAGLADRFRTGLVVALILALVLGAAGAALLAQGFLAPLRRLSRAVDAIEGGASKARLDPAGLDPELGRLATAFNGLLGRVEKVMDAERALVARASHALRTPISSILTQAEVSARRDRPAEGYREALEAIAATATDAARLADGLLALSRADAGAPVAAREDVVLAGLALELDRLFRPRAEAAGLQLLIDVPDGLVLRAARSNVRELLDALLDNAVRYTPRGGTVRLEARENGPRVTIEVLDTGPGIPPAERAQVFERFFRGSAAGASGQPGSGLGLPLVKALAQAEGAEVSIDDAPGGGTRARVVFGR